MEYFMLKSICIYKLPKNYVFHYRYSSTWLHFNLTFYNVKEVFNSKISVEINIQFWLSHIIQNTSLWYTSYRLNFIEYFGVYKKYNFYKSQNWYYFIFSESMFFCHQLAFLCVLLTTLVSPCLMVQNAVSEIPWFVSASFNFLGGSR